jgi:predicted transcriptional regulator
MFQAKQDSTTRNPISGIKEMRLIIVESLGYEKHSFRYSIRSLTQT